MSGPVAALLAACLLAGLLLVQRPAPRGTLPRRDGDGPGAHLARLRAAAGRGRARLRDPEDLGAQVGGLVAEVAALLRAGALPAAAWSEASARRPALARALVTSPDRAVRSAAAGVRAALDLAEDVGAPPGDVLDHCRAALAEAAEAETARQAALAGPRSSARLLAALPLLGLLLGAGMGADPLAVFTDGGWGTACLVLGAALMAAGHHWVGRELARAREEDA